MKIYMKIGDYVKIKANYYEEFWYHDKIMKIKGLKKIKSKHRSNFAFLVSYHWEHEEDNYINEDFLELISDEMIARHKKSNRKNVLKRLSDD